MYVYTSITSHKTTRIRTSYVRSTSCSSLLMPAAFAWARACFRCALASSWRWWASVLDRTCMWRARRAHAMQANMSVYTDGRLSRYRAPERKKVLARRKERKEERKGRKGRDFTYIITLPRKDPSSDESTCCCFSVFSYSCWIDDNTVVYEPNDADSLEKAFFGGFIILFGLV